MSRYSVHPMEKKFIKDTTGVDLDAQPDIFKKFNTQESDEIESLRKQVAYWETNANEMNAAWKKKVSDLEKDAERYRFMRREWFAGDDSWFMDTVTAFFETPEEMDASIDKALEMK